MRRTGAVLAGLAVLAATVLAAGPAGSSNAAAPADGIDYVALGDSYSAAPLVPGPPALPGMRRDPIRCARSWNNYPAYLAGYLDVRSYTDVTCSGAQVTHLSTPQGGEAPYAAPQTDALSAETDLVTLGIGGNDYGLFGSLVDTCAEVAAEHPTWRAPCRRHFTVDGVDTKAGDARLVRTRIASGVAAVRAAAPNADVLVIGYPRLLPAAGTCDEIGFAAGDVVWGDRIERLLNRSLRLGAEAQGATYVDLYPVTKGHDACAGARAWINGRDLVLGGPFGAAAFHPFRVGQRGAARAIYRAMTGELAPTAANASPPADAIVLNPDYVP